MLEAKPGAYIFIGNGVAGHAGCHAIHTPLYDFNDEILATGVDYWVNLVGEELGTP
jgi:hippurate hydrolase